MMELYGYSGFTHGGARVLTVMSPAGAGAALRRIRADDGIEVRAGDGRLPQFHEKREGALERIAAAYNIRILDKAEWDAKKAELGDKIY